MKRLFLAFAVLTSMIGLSMTAYADEDHRDHDWNDGYWHHEHYGYWHGERGYWRERHHHHQFVRVGPVTIENEH